MSNKNKAQQQQQQAQSNSKEVQHPPRYQPPPQPSIVGASSASSGKVGPQGPNSVMSGGNSGTVPSSGPPGPQTTSNHTGRLEKLQGGFGLQQPSSKGLLPSGIPTLSAGTTTPTQLQQPLPNGISGPPQTQQQQSGRQRISDDEFLRLGPVEMLKFVRKTESEMARLAAEQHRQIQTLVAEIRAMKEANQRLSDDNQELRDLCCFLDDDRQKGRKLAREWQRFGRYTASVMRQEVSAYQNKLRQLDNKQQELIKDNLELKELCLYLDEERGGGAQRDDGDGSSSSTNADETAPAPPRQNHNPHHQTNGHRTHNNHLHGSSTFNDQTMQYVRSLEQRVKQLEEDKSLLQARAQGCGWPPSSIQTQNSTDTWDGQRNVNGGGPPSSAASDDQVYLGTRPEAVVRALQVLEVREQLEREAGHDGEKALVREMCNVVWRKLEEGPAQNNRH
ncbi:hypothetical protein QAD02_000142 [Eretmocerus hayati]|uniref:Uncharacterized protein n=1 Tax=Eretmocerus hayati TaxID=131215 RepID=A0ACC2NDM8_9HYME|nr:hypothetical protein QAD02_000142 [Eretmocerus hayati]